MNCYVCCNPILKTNSALFLSFSMLVTADSGVKAKPFKMSSTTDTQTKGCNSERVFCLPASCCLCQMSILKNHSN